MRILHCCLAAFYIDNYGYQENILPKMHKLQGHEVAIVASTETYLSNSALGYITPGSYINEDGIPVTRLPYVKWLPHLIVKKLRIYQGIKEILEDFKPEIIFLHDIQFVSIVNIVEYAKENIVKIYVDGHTDLINSARNLVSRYFLHGIVYKWCAKKIEPYTKKFYGTLPLRVDFFKEVYNLPEKKIELLTLGVDDTLFDLSRRDEIRIKIRNELKIAKNDFVVICGGKIDRRKNIHLLMRAVNEINENKIKLIIFGKPNEEMKDEIKNLSNSKSIRNIGWCRLKKTYELLLASDLGVFPGTHSVLWEQSVGIGLPCVFNEWKGINHIDLGGNCLFINGNDLDTIKKTILHLFNKNELINNMRKIAMEEGIKYFSYYNIAKRAIEN